MNTFLTWTSIFAWLFSHITILKMVGHMEGILTRTTSFNLNWWEGRAFLQWQWRFWAGQCALNHWMISTRIVSVTWRRLRYVFKWLNCPYVYPSEKVMECVGPTSSFYTSFTTQLVAVKWICARSRWKYLDVFRTHSRSNNSFL